MRIGDRVKDRISGFAGIITGRTEYLNGCRQFLVSPEKVNKDGESLKGLWIDEQTLEVIAAGIFEDPFADGASPTVGGPSSYERRS